MEMKIMGIRKECFMEYERFWSYDVTSPRISSAFGDRTSIIAIRNCSRSMA